MDTNRIEKWTNKLLIFLAVGSFVLSYAGMYAIAADSGYGYLAFLWPLVTESAVIIFSLLYLVAKLHGYKNRFLMPVIIGCTVLSAVFNIWHAPTDDFLSPAVFALPPIFLFAAFKGYLWKIEQDTKRQTIIQGIEQLESEIGLKRLEFDAKLERMRSTLRQRFDEERSTLKAEIEQLDSVLNDKRLEAEQLAQQVKGLSVQKSNLEEELNQLKKDRKAVQHVALNEVNADKLNEKQQALNTLLTFYRSNPNASLAEAAQVIERSKATVSNYLNELEQQGLIYRNGKGIEVKQ